MGKKPTVSIITVTQLKRKDTLIVLADLIKKQTYRNIIEWVIVEGSKTKEQCETNKGFINELKSIEPRIIYIPGDGTVKLGELRNIGNRTCKGSITVCMDDDDYYPPTRVSHAVQMLTTSKCLIAGCSEKYLYDYCLQRFYKFKPFGPNHSTNDCMAWKREYLLTNSHDPNKSNAEEASFTKNFTEPMIQLEAKQTIISCSHLQNTFSKKEICVFTSIGIYPQATVLDVSELFMEPSFFERYCSIFKNNEISPFDIVYFTGGTSIEWDPEDHKLGGSEQAVVHLAKEWIKMGKKVAVYGKVPTKLVNCVSYFDWKLFDYSASYDTIVLWRNSGINCALQFPIKVKKLYADFHDNTYKLRFDYNSYLHKIDKIFFKSEYQLSCYSKEHPVKEGSYVIVPNGLRVSDFEANNHQVTRNQFRFCYCSCYTRGLMEILKFIWPIIYQNEPRAELHVYYGMNGVQDQEFRKQMFLLLSQPGVMDHGRMPMDLIIREKWMSTFHMYITDTEAEIDCISIRESLVAGCIPLLSNFGVFEKRDGLHFNFEKNQQSYQKIAQGILNLLGKPAFLEICRNKFKSSPTIKTWGEVAEQWLDT